MVDYGTGEYLAYDGLIDEVRIYNRALSVEESMALASATNATSAGMENAPPTAIRRWTNSLGQVFVPVPGTAVLFCIWDTGCGLSGVCREQWKREE